MIAFIPARGGSKGLPGKNIRILDGKPLITYTIEAALNARSVHRVIVTTDSIEIAEIAKDAGAEVPFLRPEYLSSDTASAVDVYIHAAEYMKDVFSEEIERFFVLLPTAPLRTSKHIDEAFEDYSNYNARTLISVTEAETPPSWYLRINDKQMLSNAGFDSGDCIQNRQNNAKFYIPNGAIYILDYNLLKNKRTYYCSNTVAYIMNRTDSIDIDTIEDFMYAEFLLKCKNI